MIRHYVVRGCSAGQPVHCSTVFNRSSVELGLNSSLKIFSGDVFGSMQQ
jgi:hypothetical protein